MTPPVGPSITELIRAAGAGDERAVDQVFPLVYDELRRLASIIRRGRAGDTYGCHGVYEPQHLPHDPAQPGGQPAV